MRFAATHKAVSYLMVSVSFVLLVLTGEVPVLLALLSGIGLIASYFFDPAAHPFMQGRTYSICWWLGLLAVTLLLWPVAAQGETLWDSGTHFLCVFLCARLWRRRSNTDYLQAYLASFLMLLVASLIGASVVYALGLLLYSVCATWTLTLFHLRREMEENYLLKHLPGRHGQAAESERVEVERILNSRRVVGSSFLLSTGALSVVLFLVAGLAFLLLPRVGVSLDLPLRRRGLLLTGFAEQIQLGSHGLLRENPKVVMRVELPAGPPPSGLRFRGLAFDHYQGGRWSRTQLFTTSPGQPPRPNERPLAHQHGYHFLDPVDSESGLFSLRSARKAEIYLEPLETSVLFVPEPGRPLAVTLPPSWYSLTAWPLVVGPDDELLVRSRLGSLHYTVLSSNSTPDPSRALAQAAPPELLPYLQLPADLPPRIVALAQQVTAGLIQPNDKALALVRYLQSGYSYSNQLEKSPGREPLDVFLFERKRGHCEYFASALAVLLRAVNIPSRSVNGYLGGEWNEFGNYLVIRQQHAHSWVEAYLPGVGWVTYDATPAVALLPPGHGLLSRLRKLSDGLEMSWNKYVLEYDLRTQQRLSDRLRQLLRPAIRAPLASGRSGRGPIFGLAVLLAFGLSLFLAQRLRRYLRYQQQPALRVPRETRGLLRRAVAELRQRGFEQRPGETLRQLAERAIAAGQPSGPSFLLLVELYYAHRFGQAAIDLAEVDRLTREVVRAAPAQPS